MDNKQKRTFIKVTLNRKDLKLTIETSYWDGTKPKRERDYLDYCSELVTLIEIKEAVDEYIKEYRPHMEEEHRSLEDDLLSIAEKALNEGDDE